MTTLKTALSKVVAGNLRPLPTVLAASQKELQEAASNLLPLLISRSALMQVLHDWRSGTHNACDVQKWASFVRRGYVAGRANEPITPIAIDYDAGDENLIVEIIGRFDEIGDPIDGQIDEKEQAEMLQALTD